MTVDDLQNIALQIHDNADVYIANCKPGEDEYCLFGNPDHVLMIKTICINNPAAGEYATDANNCERTFSIEENVNSFQLMSNNFETLTDDDDKPVVKDFNGNDFV